jgi:hypothetical protein
MHILRNTLAVGLFIFSFPLAAQLSPMQVSGASAVVVPINTLVVVTPTEEITSIDMKVGEVRNFMVVNDVIEDGAVMIRRGSPVKTTVTWRTGKGIVGKSAKFELTFNSVRSGGREWKLRGSVRQEGRGNTTGALLGAAIITGRSAVIAPGQLVNVFTAEEITSSPFFPTSNTSQYRLPSPSIPTQPAGINPSSAIRCITC